MEYKIRENTKFRITIDGVKYSCIVRSKLEIYSDRLVREKHVIVKELRRINFFLFFSFYIVCGVCETGRRYGFSCTFVGGKRFYEIETVKRCVEEIVADYAIRKQNKANEDAEFAKISHQYEIN
jgi:hypothetical protein